MADSPFTLEWKERKVLRYLSVALGDPGNETIVVRERIIQDNGLNDADYDHYIAQFEKNGWVTPRTAGATFADLVVVTPATVAAASQLDDRSRPEYWRVENWLDGRWWWGCLVCLLGS